MIHVDNTWWKVLLCLVWCFVSTGPVAGWLNSFVLAGSPCLVWQSRESLESPPLPSLHCGSYFTQSLSVVVMQCEWMFCLWWVCFCDMQGPEERACSCTLALINLLPLVKCVSPKFALASRHQGALVNTSFVRKWWWNSCMNASTYVLIQFFRSVTSTLGWKGV